MKDKRINWGCVIVDIVIIIMSVFVSVWQDNTNFLWLLLPIAFSGSYTLK